MTEIVTLAANYYQQFDADYAREVPGEGYGGWQRAEVAIDLDRTTVVVMHAWDPLTRRKYPGWYRAVEYLPRAKEILEHVFPPLLATVRAQGITLLHVVGGGDYYKSLPGYRHAVELAAPEPQLEQIAPDPTLEALRRFKRERAFPGAHNEADIAAAFAQLDFAPQVRPLDEEGVAENGQQLFALCREAGVNHLIYTGFAINWCLLMSPGGMVDMSRRGLMCSILRQATTAVENKETARLELNKQLALWRVSVAFGFVFDLNDFVRAITR